MCDAWDETKAHWRRGGQQGMNESLSSHVRVVVGLRVHYSGLARLNGCLISYSVLAQRCEISEASVPSLQRLRACKEALAVTRSLKELLGLSILCEQNHRIGSQNSWHEAPHFAYIPTFHGMPELKPNTV